MAPEVVHETTAASGDVGSAERAEHYCTLCDLTYLPQALAMHSSLVEHDSGAVLWLLCMDEPAYAALDALGYTRETSSLRPIRLGDLEERFAGELGDVKSTRTRGEYCWTLTPTLIRYALELSGGARATYVDADCYFFSSPHRILDRFEASGAHALLTPHAYAPELMHLNTAGEFCVQFVTVRATERGAEILNRWAGQCIEWCYNRYEDGKFGDQKYLEEWPARYGDDVWSLDESALTLAPWNVEYLWGEVPANLQPAPCMYHFHGFHWLSPHQVQLSFGYQMSGDTYRQIYRPYVAAVARAAAMLAGVGFPVTASPKPLRLGERISLAIHTLRNERRTARIRY